LTGLVSTKAGSSLTVYNEKIETFISEITMKDTATVYNEPCRIGCWTEIARG
jgi:hypothetical protein